MAASRGVLVEHPIRGETDFFRDDYLLRALEAVVLPHYTRPKVASVGCSDGKEPYSIILRNWDRGLQVDGYDLYLSRIAQAKSGKYAWDPRWEQRFPKPGTPAAYHITAGQLEFSAPAKARASFRVWDVRHAPLPDKYDVVITANVLMHHCGSDRQKILENTGKSLHDGGWLLCEIPATGLRHWAEYERWMHDNMERCGFRKQQVICGTLQRDDITSLTQLYRRG